MIEIPDGVVLISRIMEVWFRMGDLYDQLGSSTRGSTRVSEDELRSARDLPS
jgi:hypothetical protein